MRKNSKFTIYCLIFYCLIFTNLYSNEIKKYKSIDEFYQLNIPSKIYLNIIGEDYIKYLKQIRLVGKKQNLNVSKINSSKKKWIRGYLNTDQSEKKYNIRFILHGDFNDHIEIPYSSLRVKSKNFFFQQLEDFIIELKQKICYKFSDYPFEEIGIMSPFTRYIKLKINDNHFENYISGKN